MKLNFFFTEMISDMYSKIDTEKLKIHNITNKLGVKEYERSCPDAIRARPCLFGQSVLLCQTGNKKINKIEKFN